MSSGIVGPDGKTAVSTNEKKIEQLEARVKYLEDALVLHGSFLMTIKKFCDILPSADFKKTEPIEHKNRKDVK